MQTQNQPTTQQEMGKRKFLDASNARTIKVGHNSLLNLGPRFRQQTSAERKKNRAKLYGRSSVFLALD